MHLPAVGCMSVAQSKTCRFCLETRMRHIPDKRSLYREKQEPTRRGVLLNEHFRTNNSIYFPCVFYLFVDAAAAGSVGVVNPSKQFRNSSISLILWTGTRSAYEYS